MLRQLLIILTISTVVFSSCGGGGKGQSGKKVFRYNQTGGLRSLDPAVADARASVWATSQIFNGLLELDENMHPVGSLAESWTFDTLTNTYSFTIRKNVHFHDNKCFAGERGREVTADDFVYSFKRILAPETRSTGRWIFRHVHANPDSAFTAPDRYTFKIKMATLFPPFLEMLTMPYGFVVPHEAVKTYGETFRENPVGTGPFRFDSWKEKESLILLKNPNYWKMAPDGQQKLPYLDGIQVSFIEDPNQAFKEFQNGNLDFITGLPENAKDLLENGKIKEDYIKKYNIEKIPYMNTEYIGFQLSKDNYHSEENHPFLNKKFRQALNYAINRDQLVVTLRNGLGVPGISGVTPVALPSFDSVRVKGYTYDLKKAAELLKEAGFPNGQGLPPITFHTYPSDKEIAEFIQKQWEAIGVKVKIEQQQFSAHKQAVDEGKLNLFRGSWLGDYPNAENYFAQFYSKYLSPAGPNKTHYINEEFDKLYDEAQADADHYHDKHFDRYEIYHNMEKVLIEDSPVIILFYDEVLRIFNKNLVNLRTNPTNILMLESVDFGTGKETENKEVAAQQ